LALHPFSRTKAGKALAHSQDGGVVVVALDDMSLYGVAVVCV